MDANHLDLPLEPKHEHEHDKDHGHAHEPSIDEHIANVQQRIDDRREQLAETVEALAYKTDVGARGSEALAGGIETAKIVAGQVAENAAVQAIDATGRASDAISETIDSAKKSTGLAVDFAVATAESVEPEQWSKFRLWSLIAAGLALVVFIARRRST